jgi:hypothetical protein
MSVIKDQAFQQLFAEMVALTLGEPRTADLVANVELLRMFSESLEGLDAVAITPRLLKAVTDGMKGTANTGIFVEIFSKLASPRFTRRFNLAIAGKVHPLM